MDVHIWPEVSTWSNHGSRTAVDTDANEERYLLALGVDQTLLGKYGLGEPIDGRRKNDVRVDVSLGIGTHNGLIHVAVERAVRKRRDGK